MIPERSSLFVFGSKIPKIDKWIPGYIDLFQDDTATNNVYHFGTLFESSYIANKLKNKQW